MRNRFSVFFLLISVLFTACGNNGVPSEYLGINEMKKVMWDITRADDLASQEAGTDTAKSLKEATARYYSQVFAIHKINKEKFYKSYNYYQQHPQLYRALMDSLYNYGMQMRAANPGLPSKNPAMVQ